MKRIIINNGDGTCGILVPSPEWVAREKFRIPFVDDNGQVIHDDVRLDVVMSKLQFKDVPEGLASRITDVVNVPTDRTFRGAWTDDIPGEQIDIDMPRARSIHMDKIRVARDKKLEELDIETLKGVGVQTEKQVLRDIPQTFDISTALTPGDLKVLWPPEL